MQIPPIPGLPAWLSAALHWLYIFGDPSITANDFGPVFAGFITWLKVVGLFALIGWVLSWVVSTFRTRNRSRIDALDYAGLSALGGCFLAIVIESLQSTERIGSAKILGITLPSILGFAFGAVILVWVERALWTAIRRLGDRADLLVLAGIHLALLVGVGLAALFTMAVSATGGSLGPINFPIAVMQGVRLGATYMGFVVLARVAILLVPELIALRPRRLFAIAKQSVTEAIRRMWAPWVVIALFAVILAFAHWFLPTSQARPAESSRIYVGTLSLLTMLLLTVMVTIMAPLSLPQDIQMQTIYTVVSKPVRRLELIWGRLLGYMAIVSVLVVIFGFSSLAYLYRNIYLTIGAIEKQAASVADTDPERARFLKDQAEQLRTRMSARLPIKGSLTFTDSLGTPQIKGIDVGQELEYRSHIEGATPASAIWTFGKSVPDPYDTRRRLDRAIPVDLLLVPGTIEAIENQAAILQFGVNALESSLKNPNIPAEEKARVSVEATRAKSEIQALRAESVKKSVQYRDLLAKADQVEKEKKLDEANDLREQANEFHSPPVEMEMTFTIYRTTKGRVGEPVYAEIEVENPRTDVPKFRSTFPIREYYSNKRLLPSSYLVGSLGDLKVTVRCTSGTQYLGMAESDFHLVANKGNFGTNFFLGLFGIWLQAMVLTAIGVFAGTFLSWPVALLFTIAFFVAGHAAFSILQNFYLQTMVGGGPFESLLRLLAHDNQMSDLSPTLAVVVAKTFDAVATPVMARMVYLIPNLESLDATNMVAEGFAITGPTVLANSLVALSYVIPFTISGYLILKNREVAA